jgi:RHS repeat-associated protein
LETPNTDFPDLKVMPRYNGNIAEVDWRTATAANDHLRRYGYVYDSLNRLSAGFYQKDSNPSAKEYFEKLEYDLNGNITNLKISSELMEVNTAANFLNNLNYTYQGNRLTSVKDLVPFIGGYKGGTMQYDANGNMTSNPDKNKMIITYNFLNLPSSITETIFFNSTNDTYYTYRADGTKVSKRYIQMGAEKNTEYLDGFQYNNLESFGSTVPTVPTLKFVPTPEGYFDFEKNKYIYNYIDHLGNVRLSYFNNGMGLEVVEENNYYPFGLKHSSYNSLPGNYSYQYKYNGKELQETGMYDYGARFYMPDLGRWGVIDPLAEKFNRYTPYAYVVNDPINGIDPDGRDVIFLADSKAVPVAGHGAVIVGSERDGWYYYSMNGTGEGSSPYGDSKNPDIGTFLGKGLSPKQAMLKANTINPKEQHHYDKFVTVKTTREEDEKIKEKAAEAASAKKYKVIGQSCANVMLNCFNQIVDLRNNAWYVPHQVNPAPNAIIDNFQKGVNYYNRFFLPSDKEIQVRKVGKIEIGPVIDEKGVEHYK